MSSPWCRPTSSATCTSSSSACPGSPAAFLGEPRWGGRVPWSPATTAPGGARAIHASGTQGWPLAFGSRLRPGLQTTAPAGACQISAAKTAHARVAVQRQIAATDNQIDRLVYELYGLTDDGIRLPTGKASRCHRATVWSHQGAHSITGRRSNGRKLMTAWNRSRVFMPPAMPESPEQNTAAVGLLATRLAASGCLANPDGLVASPSLPAGRPRRLRARPHSVRDSKPHRAGGFGATPTQPGSPGTSYPLLRLGLRLFAIRP